MFRRVQQKSRHSYYGSSRNGEPTERILFFYIMN